MLKGMKNRVKKAKNKIQSIGKPSSPNPQSADSVQESSNLASASLADPTTGTALGIQEPTLEVYPNIASPHEPRDTAPNAESSTPSSGSGTALAIRVPVPVISVQPPSNVYVDLIAPSDVRDKASPASIGFQGFKTILTVVREAADAFPPLKSVAGGLLGLIDIVEVRGFDHFNYCSNISAYRLHTIIKMIV
jgi:hypothetical protein